MSRAYYLLAAVLTLALLTGIGVMLTRPAPAVEQPAAATLTISREKFRAILTRYPDDTPC